jgi:SAM-dependent methyltransferase
MLRGLLKRIYGNDREDSSLVYLERWVKEIADSLANDALVLDAGCGSSPYRSLFSRVRYECADFCKSKLRYYEKITYVCDLTSIPVQDNRYDLVLCTQVLEHVPEPKAVLKEFRRILKPNAKLAISAPLFYEEHGVPYDYYRYTQFGFRHLLSESGFEIEKMEWLEGYYGTLSYQMRVASNSLRLNPKYYGGGMRGLAVVPIILLAKQMFRFLDLLFGALDIRYKNVSTGHCINYAIVAAKTNRSSSSD